MTWGAADPDDELVRRVGQGDPAAVQALVARKLRRVLSLAERMLGDAAEAEDVAQETFVRAYRALARFDGRSEPYTWFYRIAINLSLNRIRARKSSRTSQSSDDPRLAAVLDAHAGSDADPLLDTSRAQFFRALTEAIDSLSESLRVTLILVCVDGRSHAEAAEVLGAPEGTIAWRVHEARRKLKQFLVGRGFDPDGEGQ